MSNDAMTTSSHICQAELLSIPPFDAMHSELLPAASLKNHVS